MTAATTSILWFRRDLRLSDHPALLAAIDSAARVLPVFVLDPGCSRTTPRAPGGCSPRSRRCRRTPGARSSCGAATPSTSSRSSRRRSAPSRCTSRARRRPTAAAATRPSRRPSPTTDASSSPPARRMPSGRVASSTSRARPTRSSRRSPRPGAQHGWPAPADRARKLHRRGCATTCRSDRASRGARTASDCPRPARRPRCERWASFLDDGLDGIRDDRDRPDLDSDARGCRRHLKFGEMHPRTLLADLAAHSAGRSQAREHLRRPSWPGASSTPTCCGTSPHSAWHDLRPELAADALRRRPETDRLVDAWREGRTGYPIVDAGDAPAARARAGCTTGCG